MNRSRRRPEADADAPPSLEDARDKALRLLARREHSAKELRTKLIARGLPAEIVDAAVQGLAEENLQSDARFAEGYTRNRCEQGYGPLRIRAELRERGVDDALIDLNPAEGDWRQRAEAARRKRFGATLPTSWKERARQARFLQYRGFSAEHIRELLSEDGG